jgi:uncharacterized protein
MTQPQNHRLTLANIERLTLESGGNWGLAHVRRLLKLIELIDGGLKYDKPALTWAVYLHDWGSYPKYAQSGVEHALRSRQVAEAEILPCTDLPDAARAVILEAIELHDYRDPRPAGSGESLLLREADFLDFLGAVGIAREFAKGPKDLEPSYRNVLKRQEQLVGRFTLPQAQRLARERLAVMNRFLHSLLEESFGRL